MNTTTRRLVTAAAGVAIAMTGVAATGAAAHAAKPTGPSETSVEMVVWDSLSSEGANLAEVSWFLPTSSRSVQTTQCFVDSGPVECQVNYTTRSSESPAEAHMTLETDYYSAGTHTFSVRVTSKKGTYVASAPFTGHGA